MLEIQRIRTEKEAVIEGLKKETLMLLNWLTIY